MKFRKKPVVIDAFQFAEDEFHPEVWKIWKSKETGELLGPSVGFNVPVEVVWGIKTLEGWHEVTPGDWVIKGVKGEFCPCKPDIFAMIYEPEEPAL